MTRADNRTSARTVSRSVHWQRFQVPYEYPVYFTEDLFAAENPVFVGALARVAQAVGLTDFRSVAE